MFESLKYFRVKSVAFLKNESNNESGKSNPRVTGGLEREDPNRDDDDDDDDEEGEDIIKDYHRNCKYHCSPHVNVVRLLIITSTWKFNDHFTPQKLKWCSPWRHLICIDDINWKDLYVNNHDNSMQIFILKNKNKLWRWIVIIYDF